MGQYEVGVAIAPMADQVDHVPENNARASGVPGFDETLGRKGHLGERRPILIEKGEEAVRAATEAVAHQIAQAADRIANVIEAGTARRTDSGMLGLESVEVCFGISLTGGIQAMFTSQIESSVQVTITLSRRLEGTDSGRS